MGSQLFDSPPDPFLGFASETPVAPAAEREPAFLRIPVTYDAPSIASIVEQPPAENVRVRLVGTVAVLAGLMGGFAAGYGFAYRVIASAPAPAPTLVIAAPGNPPAPPRTAPLTELPREASVPAPAPQTNSNALAVPAPPPSTTRTRVPSRAAAQPATAATTNEAGVIEVLSNRGAQVFLDGDAVGRAPLSIPDVSAGTHEVRVELPGFSPWAGSIRVKGGTRTRIAAALQP